jgi:hypothetical protein
MTAPLGLSPEQSNALAVGQALYRPIRRAVLYARFDGWTIGVFAALTVVCGISSPTTLLLGGGMGIIAWFELRQATRLAMGDVDASRRLALNQVALAGLLIAYAIWQMFRGADNAELDMIRSQLGGADPAMAEMIESIARVLPIVVYGTLIIVAVCVQGGTALFYRSRGKAVDAFVRKSPEWVRAFIAGGSTV